MNLSRLKQSLISWFAAAGFEPVKTVAAVKNIGTTLKEFAAFKRQNAALENAWPTSFSAPCFIDRRDSGGVASGHYFHQDMLVARRISEANPKKHVDVGSRVDGFVAHVAVFREIEVFDIRPIPSTVKNILFVQRDIMDVENCPTDYCDSLSCLHALEHFGLGRYGDPIDAEGYIKGFNALTQILEAGGILYLSIPIGTERVEFNGHRVFSLSRVCELYLPCFELVGFSFVNDQGNLIVDHVLTEIDCIDNLNLNYGCGIFELRKRLM